MMLLTAMILAAGSVGTVAGTGAKQVQAAENAYYYVSLGNLQQTAMTKNSASITWEQTYASSMNTLTTEGYNIYLEAGWKIQDTILYTDRTERW